MSTDQLGHPEDNSVCVQGELGGGDIQGIEEHPHEPRKGKLNPPDVGSGLGDPDFRRTGFGFGTKRDQLESHVVRDPMCLPELSKGRGRPEVCPIVYPASPYRSRRCRLSFLVLGLES